MTTSAFPTVLITGCSEGGIGFHLCQEFARMGCTVFASARNVDKMAALEDAIYKIRLDISSDEDVRRTVKEVIDVAGKIDIVVNNAGVDCNGPVIEVPMNQVASAFETNFFGALRIVQAVAPYMVARKSGLIINTSSIAAEVPTPWGGAYAASKAALATLTDVLDMELRPFDVNVMLLVPGLVRSRIAENAAPQQVNIPADSPYAPYADKIAARGQPSPDVCMDTAAFAQEVVKQAMKKSPPRLFRLGGYASAAGVMKCLPRGMLLSMSTPSAQ